jgi:pilus assembly protein CpaF
MIDVVITSEDGSRRVWRGAPPVLIGRGDACPIRVPGWRVARTHARLSRTQSGVDIEDLGSLAGTQVNARRITRYGPLLPDDEIFIGGAMLQVRIAAEPGGGEADVIPAPSDVFERTKHEAESPDLRTVSVDGKVVGESVTLGASSRTAVLRPELADLDSVKPSAARSNIPVTVTAESPSGAHEAHTASVGRSAMNPVPQSSVAVPTPNPAAAAADLVAATSLASRLLERSSIRIEQVASVLASASDTVAAADDVRWRRRLHSRLLDGLDLRRRDVSSMSDAVLREEAGRLLAQLIETDPELPPDIDRELLRQHVLDEAVGLGPLEGLLADEAVTEIMVNRFDEIFVERAGKLRRHPTGFSSERAVLGVIERIVAPLGRRIDESSPMVDARLRDGSRVNAVIAPVALRGAALTIRKFSKRRLGVDDLIAVGAVDAAMAHFLCCCIEQRCNVLVSGGTGSGKTTLLNVLSNFIPLGERIITIEDAAELRLRHPHLVSLESRPANLEGRGAILIRDLVRNALRMRPDRIVIGECRGAEALDMLQAMNTGHEGSLTTLHANTPRDAIARLETLVLMAGMDLPLTAIREQIASAIDIVIQQTRASDGRRRITSIVELTGMESGRIQLQELFRFQPPRDADAPDGVFVGCGLIPSKFTAWREAGVDIETDLFFGSASAQGARQAL